ncbi:hypothetical protein [Proteus myxofaciens]|uniref:hypothetical protein n=1 Tax=Proteus myxofaciens TaxID=184072 RepID=UPI0009446416|nr:hypothetical protein [Proteus myxofaciens]
MIQLFSFAVAPSGTCGNDDYGARRLLQTLISSKNPFYSAYRQMRSLPSNCRLSLSSTQYEVMGGFANVR